MLDFIKLHLNNYKFNYHDDLNKIQQVIVYKLFKFNNLDFCIKNIDPLGILERYLGIYYIINRNFQLAESYFLVSIKKGNINSMVNLADHYRIIHKFDKMVVYYKLAISNNKSCLEALLNLAKYFDKTKKPKESKKYYLLISKLDIPDNISGHAFCKLGDYYSNKKIYVKMEPNYLSAVNKKNSCAMVNLGYYYGEIGKISEMINLYNSAIKLGNPQALNNLGYYYKGIGLFEKAIDCYKLAIQKKNYYAMFNLACYYSQIKNFVEMEKYLLMAADLNYPEAIFKLAVYYKSINKYTDMEIYFLKNIKNNHKESLENLVKYYHENKYYEKIMVLYYENNKLEELINFVQEILKLDINLNNNMLEIIRKLDKSKLGNKSAYLKLIYKLLNNNIDLLYTHFKYLPNSRGYFQAKHDFYNHVNKI